MVTNYLANITSKNATRILQLHPQVDRRFIISYFCSPVQIIGFKDTSECPTTTVTTQPHHARSITIRRGNERTVDDVLYALNALLITSESELLFPIRTLSSCLERPPTTYAHKLTTVTNYKILLREFLATARQRLWKGGVPPFSLRSVGHSREWVCISLTNGLRYLVPSRRS